MEVLIATLIMVMSIVTVTAAVRQSTINREKLRHYEQVYDATLSLRDRIMNSTLKDNIKEKGTLNGMDYRYDCKLVQSANNYLVGEDDEQSGNKGAFLIMLFKIHLAVGDRDFEFYKTQYERRFAATDD